MNPTFHLYRTPAWSRLKRYFVEWGNRALIRRELRILSDRQFLGGYHSTRAACS